MAEQAKGGLLGRSDGFILGTTFGAAFCPALPGRESRVEQQIKTLWLTVVVAVAVAWQVQHRRDVVTAAEVQRAALMERDVQQKTAKLWKLRATTAARLMEQTGWNVTWKDNGGVTYRGHGQTLDVGAPPAWNTTIE